MKISLRAGEKIYMNGAVFSVDRRVSLHLLNNVTFLLEAHIMQAREATTSLRQVYFAIQTMLMDPGCAKAILTPVCRTLDEIGSLESDAGQRERLERVNCLLRSGSWFDALRQVREIYRAAEMTAVPGGQASMEVMSGCK